MKSKIQRIRFLRILFSLLFAILCGLYGSNVSFSQQWPLYEALRTTSAIVFGVMGAWLAIIYPGILSHVFDKKTLPDTDQQNVNKLLSPMYYATMILIVVLFVGVFAPILKQFSSLMKYAIFLRGLSYSILAFFTVLQLWALLLIFIPQDIVGKKIGEFQSKHRFLQGFKANQEE